MLEKKDRLERTVLQSLLKCPTDYYNAFASISRGTRFIYIHAYQSHIWNQSVSQRLVKFGHDVLIGDLVVPKDQYFQEQCDDCEEEGDEKVEE